MTFLFTKLSFFSRENANFKESTKIWLEHENDFLFCHQIFNI